MSIFSCCTQPHVNEENNTPKPSSTTEKSTSTLYIRQANFSTATSVAKQTTSLSSNGSPMNSEVKDGKSKEAKVKEIKEKEIILNQDISSLCLSYQDMKDSTNEFGRDTLIGEGSTGRVHVGKLKDGTIVAVRLLKQTEQSEDSFLNQITVLSKLKQDNILRLKAYCMEGNTRILATEFAPNGSLHDVLHGRKGGNGPNPRPALNWSQRVRIAMGVARALLYLHENFPNNLTYKCIKSSNVMLFDGYFPKIGDFNFTKHPNDISSPIDSELENNSNRLNLSETTITQKSDIYAFGIILLELLTGRKSMDPNIPNNQQSLVAWAMPRLTINKVNHIVDPRLKGRYPPDGPHRIGIVAALCMDDLDYRPNMHIVLTALQPLLKMKTPAQSPNPHSKEINSTYTTPMSSLPVSRVPSRTTSRTPSRAPSRPLSRSSSRPGSQPPSQPASRPSSRPASRTSSCMNSRSSSRNPSRHSSQHGSRESSRPNSRSISPIRTHSYIPNSAKSAPAHSHPKSHSRKSSNDPYSSTASTPTSRFRPKAAI